MQALTLFSRLSFAVSVLGLAAALPSYAATTSTLYLVDTSSGATVTIDSTGHVTFGGTCNTPGVTCSTTSGFPVIAPGIIEWAGTLGRFSVNPVIGRITTPPNNDVELSASTGAAGGTLKTYWSTAGIQGAGPVVALNEATTVTTGSVTAATFSAYVDNNNGSLQNGNPPGTLSATITAPSCVPLQSCTGTATGPGPKSNPFSLTNVASLTLAPNSLVSTDYMIQVMPAALTLGCADGKGQVGVPYSSRLHPAGGIPPYTFSIASGSLPPGLKLDPTTGFITGTPTSSGAYGYTAKVVDHSGAVAFSNCTSSCTTGGTPVTINLDAVLGNLGNSHVYLVNGIALTAYGFAGTNPNAAGTPTALFAKNDGATENGLGIAGEVNHEINASNFVQFDVSLVLAAHFTNARIAFNSVQSGESYVIYGSNTLGVLGTKLSGPGTTANALVAMPGYGTYKYIGIQAGSQSQGDEKHQDQDHGSGDDDEERDLAANVLISQVAFGSPGTACTIIIAPAAPVKCGMPSKHWKDHDKDWPMSSMNLGDHTYNKSDLLNLLSLNSDDDDSSKLAAELIAAKLNVAYGTDPSTAGKNIDYGDHLLSGYHKPLTYRVHDDQMKNTSEKLHDFNDDGKMQNGCKMPDDSDENDNDGNDHEDEH